MDAEGFRANIAGTMPASALRSAATVLLVVLVACRTRDNPETCTRADPSCGPLVCDFDRQLCVDRGDGRADGPPSLDGRPEGGTPSETGTGDTGTGGEPEAGCRSDGECTAAGTGRCLDGRCVACLGPEDCNGTPLSPICAPDHSCVRCDQAQAPAQACASRNASTPFCATTGACVQCLTSQGCTDPAAPICVQTKCVPCTADTQCADRDGADPGLCLAGTPMGGRCARAADVIYVRRTAPCMEGAAAPGTAEMPFCRPAEALTKVTATQRVLVLRGQDPFQGFSVLAGSPAATGGPVAVFGQPGAAIAPGANPGITIRAGEVYLRGLTVRDSDFTGVVVDGEATVHLDQSLLRLNRKGGLMVTGGAGFSVSNTVFDSNGVEFIGGVAPFGGAYLGQPAGGRPAVFRFNTVVGNAMVGVLCGTPGGTQVLQSVLLWNNGTDQRNCRTPNSLEGMMPAFDPTRPYHLTSMSLCKDKGDPAAFPPNDIDGEPRPAGPRSDCGADEFHED